MKDSEVIRCTKCNAELHPEFVPPVNIMEHYYCPECAKDIKKFMKIEAYECFFYRQGMEKGCKYYPKQCSKCTELIKVGEVTDDGKNRRNKNAKYR